jgi:hypothetical protein
MNTTTIVLKGKELSESDLQVINHHRVLEFDSKHPIQPEPGNEDWEMPFFLVKDEVGKILAMARLHEVVITFMERNYDAYGIATIIAMEKGKGYGSQVLKGMKDYIEESGKLAIGFCDPKNAGFYIKCDYQILRGQAKRFLFKSSEGDLKPIEHQDNDLIVLDVKNMFLPEFTSNPDEFAFIPRKHW